MEPSPRVSLQIGDARVSEAPWKMEAQDAKAYELRLQVRAGDATAVTASTPMLFLPLAEERERPHIPKPIPVDIKARTRGLCRHGAQPL